MKKDSSIEKLNTIKVYVCGTTTGKSWLADRDDRFFDLDTWHGDYKFGTDSLTYEEKEKIKRHCSLKQIRFDNKEKTFEKMQEMLSRGKIILMCYTTWFVDMLMDKKIPWCLVFNTPTGNAEILNRIERRNNPKEFYQYISENIEQWRIENKNDERPNAKIELKKGEFVSDILIKVFEKM